MEFTAIKAKQQTRDIYVGVLPAAALVPITHVDTRRPDNVTGYQRELQKRRISEVKHYLESADGVFPSSVLLSYRSSNFKFKASPGGAPSSSIGTLELGDKKPKLYVIDGQHRIEALRAAIAEDPARFKDFPVPFTLLVNPDVFEEARWFYLVNSKAKRVPIELAEELLATAAETKGEDWLRNAESLPGSTRGDQIVLKTHLVKLIDRLEEICPVWNGHVIRSGQKASSPQDAKAHTINTSITRGGVLSDRIIAHNLEHQPELLAQALSAYWVAISRKWPVAIGDGKNYSLRGTQGLYSLHAIFPDVLERCRETKDFSAENMYAIIDNINDSDAFWRRNDDGSNPLTQSTSMGFLRRLARYLRDQLPEPSIPSL